MMKLLLLIYILLISTQAHAQIFMCKDNQNKISYQDEACSNVTIRTLKNVPDAPIEEQILARERIRKVNELSQQRALNAEAERLQQEKINREYQTFVLEKRKLELLEKQIIASEQAVAPQWILGGRSGFGINKYGLYGSKTYRSRARNHDRPSRRQ